MAKKVGALRVRLDEEDRPPPTAVECFWRESCPSKVAVAMDGSPKTVSAIRPV